MLQKIPSLVRELGAPWAFLYLVDRLLRTTGVRWYPYAIVRQPATAQVALPAARRRHLSWRLIDEWDDALDAFPTPRAVMIQRLGSGARCLLAFNRDRLIGFAWFRQDSYEEDEVRCLYQLPSTETAVWDFDVLVLPEQRGTFAFAYLWCCIFEYLASSDIAASYSRISRFNVASMKAHQALGAELEGHLLFLRAGRWQLLFSGRLPYLHLSTSQSDRPAVQI